MATLTVDGLGFQSQDSSEAYTPADTTGIVAKTEEATALLKAMSHEGRLMILCYLTTGEKSVTELERILNSRQAAVSQQLARLRQDGLVTYRRDGKAIYYSIADQKARRVLDLIHEMYCTEEHAKPSGL